MEQSQCREDIAASPQLRVLMAEGERDRIEFWEGNLIFYSDQPAQLEEARAIAKSFDCPAKLL